MATTEEIERRVRQADTARSARRAAAARQIGDLAQRRACLAEQVDDIERELADVLAAVRDVMTIDELAAFTDVPAADLTRLLTARTTRKPGRTKRRQPTGSGRIARDIDSRRSATTPAPGVGSGPTQPAEPRADSGAVDVPARVSTGMP
ncbi:hypothetical protein [Alloactinosynnema sp. L-07]|uniref:hypothetical protein n=1 Tax=Alloactinosynnema sp. L-07 TaxID=1653480 RepID=UPI00065EF0DE|nr:hypothetical protein [Alloactinosynnema sp. L-07]CRK57634.1 hypothetical protein [Alloactinosynnema sp. L-07]